MLRWESEYEKGGAAHSTAAVIQNAIDRAPSYYAGELETLRDKLNKMSEIVGCMTDLMDAQSQRELVRTTCYGWKESK